MAREASQLLHDNGTVGTAQASGRRREMTDTTATLTHTAHPPALTAADRCDRCGAQAYVRAVLPGGGDLVFCKHHGTAYDGSLRKVAVRIVDESDKMGA
jgi:hypothetical protein